MFVCEFCEVKAIESNPVPMQVEEGIAFRLDSIDAFCFQFKGVARLIIDIVLRHEKAHVVLRLTKAETFYTTHGERSPWVACKSYRVLIGVEPWVRKQLCYDSSSRGAHRGGWNNAPDLAYC